MSKLINRLEFIIQMKKKLKKKSFDVLFEDDNFTNKFGDLINSPQAKKWLTTPQGICYINYNRS